MLSPVIADWSQDRLPDIISPSAHICSPASGSNMSPTTMSSMGIAVTSPSRMTLHIAPFDLSSRRSKADCEPYSDIVEIKVASNTETAMPMLSTQLACLNVRTRFSISAPIRIFITGSPRLDINCLKKLFRLDLGKMFLPNLARDSKTSACESPEIRISLYLSLAVIIYHSLACLRLSLYNI